MSAIKRSRPARRQRGSTVVEFALVVLAYFVLIFLIIELARLMFLYNTLQDATRRAATAAAAADFSNTAAMDKVRQQAIFRSTPGGLVLMNELTDRAIRIDYLSLSRSGAGALASQSIAAATLPASPAENRQNCVADPYASNCMRLVRVRVCDPDNAASCTAMKFRPLTALTRLELDLPLATTIAPVQSLGLAPN